MKDRIISKPVALIISLVFYIASVIVFWKIVEDGSTARRLISAIGFAVAAILWTAIYIRSRGVRDQSG